MCAATGLCGRAWGAWTNAKSAGANGTASTGFDEVRRIGELTSLVGASPSWFLGTRSSHDALIPANTANAHFAVGLVAMVVGGVTVEVLVDPPWAAPSARLDGRGSERRSVQLVGSPSGA